MRSRTSVPHPLALVAAAVLVACALTSAQTVSGTNDWQSLFDGKTLTNWRPSKFFGQGPVRVEDGRILLEPGNDLTGITWAGDPLPTSNYELALEAMRVEGSDFFAGITFPVKDSFCSLILGGWGGQVVGLSSINDMDASENSTSQSREFERNRWYPVRIRVTDARIEAWLEDKPIIDQELKGNRVGVRMEVEASQPLGIASWRTTGAVRNIRIRRL